MDQYDPSMDDDYSSESDGFEIVFDEGPATARANNDDMEVIEVPDVAAAAAAGPVIDENMNQGGEGLVMPVRKRKEPSPVWKCAERLEGGGARCKFCQKTLKTSCGSTSTIVQHLVTRHSDKEAVKVLNAAMRKKREATNVKRLKDQKRKSNKQPSILNFAKRRGVLDPLKKKRIDESLVKMTIAMNKPFLDVENPFFRQLMFNAEPNYLCPSRQKLTAWFDSTAEKVKEALKEEIIRDISEAGHNTISICTDHGTSADRFRSKKNAVTVARTTKDFKIKKDTLKLLVCEGSQTGAQIRKDVKQALIHGAGWREGVKINWVTDNESKQINARNPSKHQAVGLPTNHVGK